MDLGPIVEDCVRGTMADGGRSTGMRGQPVCQQAQGHAFYKPVRSNLRTGAAVRLVMASSLAPVHQTSFHQGRTKRGCATKDSGCAVQCSSTSAESNAPSSRTVLAVADGRPFFRCQPCQNVTPGHKTRFSFQATEECTGPPVTTGEDSARCS